MNAVYLRGPATPIPRSLALTLYGDLDISVINQLPPGRKPIVTAWYGEKEREKAYRAIRHTVDSGGQVNIVYPKELTIQG